MAKFDLEELELLTDYGGRDTGEGTAIDWRLHYGRNPPSITRLPPTWVLPMRKGAQFDGLLELTSEYVSRKYVVLAEHYGLTTFPCQGIMSLTDGTNFKAGKAMSAYLKARPTGCIHYGCYSVRFLLDGSRGWTSTLEN
jgi:hypothetical protein